MFIHETLDKIAICHLKIVIKTDYSKIFGYIKFQQQLEKKCYKLPSIDYVYKKVN